MICFSLIFFFAAHPLFVSDLRGLCRRFRAALKAADHSRQRLDRFRVRLDSADCVYRPPARRPFGYQHPQRPRQRPADAGPSLVVRFALGVGGVDAAAVIQRRECGQCHPARSDGSGVCEHCGGQCVPCSHRRALGGAQRGVQNHRTTP